MLYSIIPPILIVLSLIAIIVFLMKKSKKVASISEELMEEEMIGKMQNEQSGSLDKASSARLDGVKHFSLTVLEKMTSKSRVLFLRLESKFSNWSNSIREKRKNRLMEQGENISEIREDNDIMKKLREYEPKKIVKSSKRKEEIASPEKKERGKFSIADLKDGSLPVEKEKIIKPIISEKVVSPRQRTEIKDRLEELLIERIAVNPKDVEAYERLGEYYLEIKSLGDAKECFKQVIKLDPSNRNAKYRMRRLENLLTQK